MKKSILLFGLCLALQPLFSQTKKIAYKSHSGDIALYNPESASGMFATATPDFGLNTEAMEHYPKDLATVVYLQDSIISPDGKVVKVYRTVHTKDSLFHTSGFADSVRNCFKKQYPDTTTARQKKNLFVPVVNNTPPPSAPSLPLYISLIALFAVFTALFSWNYQSIR